MSVTGLLRAGQVLKDGEIQIIDLVGSGGIGEVYRASMVRDGQRQLVAVKCFNPDKMMTSDYEALEIVHRECVAVSRIHHPNIVRILEVNIDGKLPIIVEEFLEGGDLAKAISERKKHTIAGTPVFSPEVIATLGRQICAGLMCLHQNNQYHGDLKPSNLCFRSGIASDIVIVDFGHSGFLEDNLLERNEKLATLAYIPPERTGFVKMAGYSSSDLYSLGVTLYETALGQPPFVAADSRGVINRLLYEVPKPLCDVLPGFPLALSDIISKLLRKNPQDRYHSAFGLGVDLDRCLQSLTDGSSPQGFALGTKDKLRELNYRIPMVGRDHEMHLLLTNYEKSHQGEANLTLIGAPSGMGKSRLAFEVLRSARASSACISHAKFSEFERNLPLSAISLLLMEHAHYLKSRTPEVLSRWQQNLREKLGERGHLIAERFRSYGNLLPEFPRLTSTTQDNSFQFFNETLAEFLGHMSASGETHLILMDDLQWADVQSIQVLGFLADGVKSGRWERLMILGTYRSDEVLPDQAFSRILLSKCSQECSLLLGPLTRSASDHLVSILLEEEGPDIARLQDVTYRFTSGNPFYIYEYLKSAIYSGIYAFDESRKTWNFHEEKIHQANLSDGVAALVGERIRLLDPIGQALIGLASIAGQAMGRRALLELFPTLLKARGKEDLLTVHEDREQLIELTYQDLLQKNLLAPDSSCFMFFHDKIQESSYATLTSGEKESLHLAYGLWCAKDVQNRSEKVQDTSIFEAALHICKGDSRLLTPFACHFLVDAARTAQRVFAYDKAKDYLSAVISAHQQQNRFSDAERFEALELLANTLTISDQVVEALQIYDKLLEFECTPLQKASIYCKKSEYALSLLDYRATRDAAMAGLEALGAWHLKSIYASYIYMLIFMPILALYALFFMLFGRQTKEIKDPAQALKFELQLKTQLSQYMLAPIIAIANLSIVTFELMAYKDCFARITTLCYWGVSLGPVGLNRWSSRLMARAYDYFDRTADPVNKAFVLFQWGSLSDMPTGDLASAQKKLEEAVSLLQPIGESFWRAMSIFSMMTMDFLGSESGQAGIRSHELIELWKKLRFNASGLSGTLRHFLESEQDEQLQYYKELSQAAAQKLHDEGFDSIDSLMTWLHLGEYYELIEDYEKATDLLRRASWLGVTRLHRSSSITYAPIALTRTLIHQHRLREALLPLAIAWLNQLLNVRLFLPQTLYISGYWLNSVGWHRTGQRIIEIGIQYARRKAYGAIVAEGQLLLGRLQVKIRPEMAAIFLQLARDYYQQHGWKYHSQLCDKQLVALHFVQIESHGLVTDQTRTSLVGRRRGTGIRQIIEMKSLFELLLKLSAISQKEVLFQTLMEALCHATGSELALLIFKEGEEWTQTTAFNLDLKSPDLFKSRIDKQFIEQCTGELTKQPVIRSNSKTSGRHLIGGSAMMVPLIFEGKIYGYCYLGNTQIYDLYDNQSMEIAGPICIQATIALQNITLNSELSIERDQLAQLHRTLEQRVMEQTRDIKSIMQHINMGICTVSGPGVLIDKDYSLYLEKLFGESGLNGKPFLPLLLAHSELGQDERDQVKNVMQASMNELVLGFVANDHILPRMLRGSKGDQVQSVLELNWIPITNENRIVEKVLVTINDVSELKALEQQAHQKNRNFILISEIVAISHRDWQLFSKSCERLLLQNQEQLERLELGSTHESVFKKIFLNLHTIKGNARALGFKLMSDIIHESEQYFADLLRTPQMDPGLDIVRSKLESLVDVVKDYREVAEGRLGWATEQSRVISLSRDSVMEFFAMMCSLDQEDRALTPGLQHALREVRDVLFLTVEASLRPIFVGLETLAIDLGKSCPEVLIDAPDIWVSDDGGELLRNCFLHLVRNALDHGIEAPAERIRKGKNATGVISIVARVEGHCVEFRLTDDGRGLNLRKIAQQGLERGLVTSQQCDNDKALAALIFAPDFSTADQVTDISGRGVGMTAVAQYLQDAGGDIHIEFLDLKRDDEGYRRPAFLIHVPIGLFHVESKP